MDHLTSINSVISEEKLKLVLLRERFTNLLARIATHDRNMQMEPLSVWNTEYDDLRSEVELMLVDHPEWRDVASHYLPISKNP